MWSSIYNGKSYSTIMVTVTILLGKDTAGIYRKTGNIPSVESTAESGGYVITPVSYTHLTLPTIA